MAAKAATEIELVLVNVEREGATTVTEAVAEGTALDSMPDADEEDAEADAADGTATEDMLADTPNDVSAGMLAGETRTGAARAPVPTETRASRLEKVCMAAAKW
jgi:hypothetical protein